MPSNSPMHCIALALLLPASAAGAQAARDRGAGDSCSDAAGTSQPHCSAQAEAQPRFDLGVDAVVAMPRVVEATDASDGIAYRVSAQSYVLSIGYELHPRYRVSARVPVIAGMLSDNTLRDRSTVLLGNVELETEHEIRLTDGLRMTAAVSAVIPTMWDAHEHDQPLDEASQRDDSGHHDQHDSAQTQLILRTASWSRGHADGALFEVGHVGLVSTIALEYRFDSLRVRSFVKLEGLRSTAHDPAEAWLGAVLLGGDVTYTVNQHAELALRAWHDRIVDHPKETSTLVEPAVAIRVADARMVVGAVVALAEARAAAQYVGLRAAASAHF